MIIFGWKICGIRYELSALFVRYIIVFYLLHPKPSDSTPYNIVWKIGPCEGGPEQSFSDKATPDPLKKRRMPQLEEFQKRCNSQNTDCNDPWLGIVKEKQYQKTPKDLVENAAQRIVHPKCGRS